MSNCVNINKFPKNDNYANTKEIDWSLSRILNYFLLLNSVKFCQNRNNYDWTVTKNKRNLT